MDRRKFSALLPAFFTALLPEGAVAQESGLPEIVSGVYPPGKQSGSNGHASHRYLAGMLKAGNIQLEMHESTQEPGAVHEPVGKHA